MIQRAFLAAATFAAISAALHGVALLLGGFAYALLPSALGGAIWAAAAWALSRGSRGAAWMGFLLALMGGCSAVWIALGAPSGLVQGIWAGILAADLLVAVTLFRLLWRPAPA